MSSTSNPSTAVTEGCITICDVDTGLGAAVTVNGLKVDIGENIELTVSDNVTVYGSESLPLMQDASGILFNQDISALHIDGTSYNAAQYGNIPLAVRTDATGSSGPGPLSDDGEWTPLQVDENGSLYTTLDISKEPGQLYSAGGAPKGLIPLGFIQDELGDLSGTMDYNDGDWSYLTLNSKGGLYVTGSEVENLPVQSEPFLAGGRFDISDRSLNPGDAGAIALNSAGHVKVEGSVGIMGSVTVNTVSVSALATHAKQLAAGHTIDCDDSDVNVTNMISGFATSDKQLADGHAVTFSGQNLAVNNHPTGFALETTLSDIAACVVEYDTPIGLFGIKTMGKSESITGAGFPMVGDNYDATTMACSIAGVQFVNLVTETGTKSAIEFDDVLQQPAPGMVNVGGEYRASPTTYSDDGDATIWQSDINGNLKTVKGKYSTVAFNGSIAIGTDSTEILDTRADRKYLVIVNNSEETIYIGLGSTAFIGKGIRLNALGGSYTDDMWTGEVSGICAVDAQDVTVTEV